MVHAALGPVLYFIHFRSYPPCIHWLTEKHRIVDSSPPYIFEASLVKAHAF